MNTIPGRLLGVRPAETKPAALLFLHSLLLGTGTMLVYMAATLLLLRHAPERSLPLAYSTGALAMLAAGWLHTCAVRKWAAMRRAFLLPLLALLVLTLVLGLLLLTETTAAGAVAIMAGYRVLYLFTNLESGGIAAVGPGEQPSERLRGAVEVGRLAGKALGALLAVFVPLGSSLPGLLFPALALYVLAFFVQRGVQPAEPAAHPEPAYPWLREQRLVVLMGLSLTALAVAAAGIEYQFLLHLPQRLPVPDAGLRLVAGVLSLAYALAAGLRLLVARRTPGRPAARRALAVLPALAGVGLAGAGLWAARMGPLGQAVYFSGFYLGWEVLRQTLFKPTFLVLFQAMPPAAREPVYAHIKSVYEPMGLGIGGFLLLLHTGAGLPIWVVVAGLAVALLAALGLVQGAQRAYVRALQKAVGLPAAPSAAAGPAFFPAPAVPASWTLEVLHHLHRLDAPLLVQHASTLLCHPESQVRLQLLALVGEQLEPPHLHLLLHDADAAVREKASRLTSRHPHTAHLLQAADVAVRTGAIRARLEATPTDAPALASLTELAGTTSTCHHTAALGLIHFLEPARQQALIVAGLCQPEAGLRQAAIRAATAVAPTVLLERLLDLLRHKTFRPAAADCLVGMGEAILPLLQQAVAHETDERRLREAAQVCARLGTAASRQLLVELARGSSLRVRMAALRALSSLPAAGADAPLFQHLVEEEMRLAQHMLHSMVRANAELRTTLRYELRKCQQRLLGVLTQLYDQYPLLKAQRELAHTTGERQARALEILDTLIPRPLYQGLQALLDVGRLSEKVQTFDSLLAPPVSAETIQAAIVRRGTAAFSAWTVGVALRQWYPTPDTVAYLYPHLQTPDELVRESAEAVLRRLPLQRPAAYDQLLRLHPSLATHPAVAAPVSPTAVSFLERVRMLKSTALFGQTPENVLSTIVPIMHEVSFQQQEEIFAKDTLGTSLFILYEGEVGIFNKGQLLTAFHKGEFFGELALLDAEPRSASAVALRPARAFRIDQEDFYDVTEECTEVVRSIMRELCQRLRRQNEKVPPLVTSEPAIHSA